MDKRMEILDQENFKDYGLVISETKGNPLADNNEIAYWSKVSQLNMSDSLSTGLLHSFKRPAIIKSFERHVNTPEIMVSLGGDSVILVAKPKSVPSESTEGIKAFYVKQGTAIVLNAGTWHAAPIPVNCETANFIILFNNGTEENDMDIVDIADEIKIIK